MPKNRIFFPQAALDELIVEGRVELSKDELTVRSEGRRYRLAEAAHVLREVSGSPDPFELVGRVKTLGYLNELGAEMLDTSMIIGDSGYDVVPGFLWAPIGSFAEHMTSHAQVEARRSRPDGPPPPTSDEELLGQLLLRVL